MTFAGINYIAVIAAAAAGFAVGAAWYTTLGNAWIAAQGKTRDDFTPSAIPYLIAAAAHLVMAYLLAGAIGHLGPVTIGAGLTTAVFLWLGFVLTTMAVNHAFQGAGRMLTLIDAGHWLAVMLAMGLVIGALGT